MGKFFKKLSFIVIILILIAFFSLNWIAKKGLEYAGTEAAGVKVYIKSSEISFLNDTIKIDGILVENPGGYMSNYALDIKNVIININFSSLLSERISIDRVNIETPDIIYEKNGDEQSNIKTILNNIKIFSQRYNNRQDSEKKRRLQIYDFIVTNGQINIKSKLIQERGISTKLPDIHLKDIGRGEKGKTIYEAINILLNSIDERIIDAVSGPIETLKRKGLKIIDDIKGFIDKL